ncbi:MAG: hypothetical protein ACJ77K_06455 [Bacteroidia bacterium]
MNTKKNKYVQQARQKTLAGTPSAAHVETKSDFKKTAAYTGRDILFGGLAGSLAGAIVGRSSFLVGIAVTGAGHYFGSPSAAMFGVGMMASGGYQSVSASMNGVERDGVDGIKDRFVNFKDNLKRQLFLDKIISKKTEDKTDEEQSTNGVGSVQYFKHPASRDLDFSEADRLERQIEQSAKEHAARQGVSGVYDPDDVNGLEGEVQDRLM